MRLFQDKSGLSLVETIISIIMLGIIVVSMLGATILTRIMITKAKHRAKAVNLLRSKMEWVIGQSSGTIESWIASPIIENDVDNSVGTDELINDTRTTSVAKDSDDNLIVTITLNWEKRASGGTITKGSDANPDERLVTLISP